MEQFTTTAMAALHSWCFIFFLVIAVVGKATAAYYVPVFRPTAWKLAYATFYGDETAAETMGVCQLIFRLITCWHDYIQ